jgi:hypothetical protein
MGASVRQQLKVDRHRLSVRCVAQHSTLRAGGAVSVGTASRGAAGGDGHGHGSPQSLPRTWRAGPARPPLLGAHPARSRAAAAAKTGGGASRGSRNFCTGVIEMQGKSKSRDEVEGRAAAAKQARARVESSGYVLARANQLQADGAGALHTACTNLKRPQDLIHTRPISQELKPRPS